MIILLLLWPHQIWRGKNRMPVSTYHYSIVYKVMRMNEVGGVFLVVFFFGFFCCC